MIKGGCPKYVGIPGQCFTLNLLAKGVPSTQRAHDPGVITDPLSQPPGQIERKSFLSPSTGLYDIMDMNESDDDSTVFSDVEAELLDDEDMAGQQAFDVEFEEGDEIPGVLEKRDSARQRIELFSCVCGGDGRPPGCEGADVLRCVRWPPARSGQTFM